MDADVAIAIATAGLSLIGTGVAWYQAVKAKDQAATAKTSANAAVRQAAAADAQVQLMQRQLDAEEADRQHARGPVFTLKDPSIVHDRHGGWLGTVTIHQVSGPALARVTVTPAGRYVHGISGEPDDPDGPDNRVITDLAPGGSRILYVDLEYEHIEPVDLSLRLDCQGRDGGTWVRDLGASLNRPPEPPAARLRWLG